MRLGCIRMACAVGGTLGILVASATGQSLDRPVLEQLKDATVFVKFRSGNARGGGSGLVIRVDGGKTLILTNHHVVSPDLPGGDKVSLSVVFRSGTDREQEVPATVRGSLYNDTFDLAILEAQGVNQPPRPISTEQTAAESDFFETMSLFALGFPLGEQVQGVVGGNHRANPAVTVTSMTIGSLRRDAAGQLVRIQLNGSLIQGNSGGPIVDGKGRLVGVAVSRIVHEAVGFAIPPSVINTFLGGSVILTSLELTAIDRDSAELKLSGKVVDPFGKLRSATIRRAATTPSDEPAGRGSQPSQSKEVAILKDPSPVALTLGQPDVSARFRTPISGDGSRKVTLQLTWTDTQGKVRGMYPIVIPLPDHPGVIHGPGGVERAPAEVARWSCEVNVTEGARITHQPGVTEFDLPGGIPYINTPQLASFTAPAALVRVHGDCRAVVVVDGRLDPGGEPIVGPNGQKLGLTYQGAGLLLWQDDRNFVRLERCKLSDGHGGLIHQALIEVYKNGKQLARHYSDPLPDMVTMLALERRGSTIRVLYSRDPSTLAIFQELTIDFRDDVLVGVSASNLSKRPLKIDLKGFQLTNTAGAPIAVQPFNRKTLAGPDVETLPDGTQVFEGATLKVVHETGASAIPQEGLEPTGGWSGNRQMFWRAARKGDTLTLEYPVGQAGNYDIQLLFSKGPDHGRVSVAVDGKAVHSGKPYELYSDHLQRGKAISLGTFKLARGPHRLQFHVLGKHDESTGYALGIDDVRLVPARPTTSTASKASPPKAPASKSSRPR